MLQEWPISCGKDFCIYDFLAIREYLQAILGLKHVKTNQYFDAISTRNLLETPSISSLVVSIFETLPH